MPVSVKQLAGSLIGLSVTLTAAAPARRQSLITSPTRSGWLVAPSDAGEANAALTFSTTRSPGLMNCSMPPSAWSARLTVLIRSDPVTMLRWRPTPVTEKSGTETVSAEAYADGPFRSCNRTPAVPAAAMASPAFVVRTMKSRRVLWAGEFICCFRQAARSSGRQVRQRHRSREPNELPPRTFPC